ncbi:MAG: hypothetical protein FOGNACKC_04598 [Anaerolineae bacterium]|nr:hypothetical protein [Anaerolineae bacterium]
MTPEQLARQNIDRLLVQAGWEVQDTAAMTLTAEAIAVRDFC